MPDPRPILHINGLFLTALAVLMLIPAAVDLSIGNDDWLVFWASAVVTGFSGIALVLANRRPNMALDVKQAFLLTTVAWVLLSVFAALPFKFAKVSLSYAGSFFEAASGLTTTGSTVLVGLDTMAPGILPSRSCRFCVLAACNCCAPNPRIELTNCCRAPVKFQWPQV